MALVGAGLRVEHDHAPIAVAVRDEDFVGPIVGEHVRRTIEPRGVTRTRALAAVVLADLVDEFSIRREVQDLVAIVVAADPDGAVLVDVQAVLVRHPLVAVTRAAPVAQQISVDVELHDRRRRLAAFGLGRVLLRSLLVVDQRCRTMENPDVAVRGGRDPGHLPENPVFRERFRPERLGLERRRCFCLCGLLSRSGGGQAGQSRERNRHCRENTPHRRLPAFAGGFIRRSPSS